MTNSRAPEGLDPKGTKGDILVTVEAETIDWMLKVASIREKHQKEYTLVSDEGELLGGRASAPHPLAYFSAALAF